MERGYLEKVQIINVKAEIERERVRHYK